MTVEHPFLVAVAGAFAGTVALFVIVENRARIKEQNKRRLEEARRARQEAFLAANRKHLENVEKEHTNG